MDLKKIIIAVSLSIVLLTTFAMPNSANASNNEINIQINKQIYNGTNQPMPINLSGRVYVPLRLVSEGLGYHVEWDNESRSVLIDTNLSALNTSATDNSTIQIFIKNNKLQIDRNLGTPFITPSGYTMVPVRVVAESLGAEVNWQGATNTVLIDTRKPNAPLEEVPLPQANPFVKEGERDSLSASSVTLQGQSYASLEQMQRFLAIKENTARATAAARGRAFIPFPQNIAYYYYSIGQKYNIRGDVALAQALHETGNFQYGNEVKPFQNNYCGLGAIGRVTTEEDFQKQMFSQVNHDKANLQVGIHGWCYDSIASGVEAHIQHLYSYANANPLPAGVELLDGRFAHGNRGKAIYLTDLNGKWAVPGNNYGEIIYANYLAPMIAS